VHQVRVTAYFLGRLKTIEAFLAINENAGAYEDLLDDLSGNIIAYLSQFPLLGRPFLSQKPQSVESLSALAQIPTRSLRTLREYVHKNYIILYSVDERSPVIYLLTIRHHRELSFDFEKLWQP
jgi:plasmid stabilization system protein ParE